MFRSHAQGVRILIIDTLGTQENPTERARGDVEGVKTYVLGLYEGDSLLGEWFGMGKGFSVAVACV